MRAIPVILNLLFIINNCFAQCPTPTGLFTTNITFNSALANWSPVNGVDHYKIHYRIFGTSNWGNLGNIGMSDSTRNLPLLQPGTTYEWEIMAFCDSTNQQGSSWSIGDTFSTPTFVASSFAPILTNTLSSTQCNTSSELVITLSQTPNEPDIGESTIISSEGYFDLSTLSMGDSVGFAILNTSSQTINSTLKVGFIFNNSAIINSLDSTGSLNGFFTIENENPGVKVSTTSPNDGNNYTSGFSSEVSFTNIFITPNYDGPLYFYAEINSELTDSVYQIIDSTTIMISCPTNQISELSNNDKTLLNTLDLQGRNSTPKSNQLFFYHFSDGTVEKKIRLE